MSRASHVLVSTVGLGLTAVLAGCGGGTSGSSPSPGTTSTASASASPTAKGETRTVQFTTEVSSKYSRLTTAGPDKEVVFGYNQFEGYTKINGKSVRVRMQGIVDYREGSGPITGFLELIWSDGSVLALRQEGQAESDTTGKRTDYKADVTVIGGSKDLANTTGNGSWTGSRTSSGSSSIRMAVELNLQGAPVAVTGNVASALPTASYSATIEP